MDERDRRILELEARNEELKKKVKQLERARGVPAEVLVAQLTEGKRSEGYKDSYDVRTKRGNRIEVKLSQINPQPTTTTKRWNWDRVLGQKQYDFLVLVGERDPSYENQYPPDSASLGYVFFVVPQSMVNEINSNGDCIALNTNFTSVRAAKGKLLMDYMVHSLEEFKNL